MIEYVEKYHELNQIVRDVAKTKNVSIIDLASSVPRTKEYMYDVVHLNDKGSILVSQLLTSFFEKKLRN